MKEWSAVVDALGSGQQIILIRKRAPRYQDFLLFPTFTYYQRFIKEPEKFDALFQAGYVEAARKSGAATMKQAHDDMLGNIDYFAHVDQTLAVSGSDAWDRISGSFIWAPKHVKEYAASAAGPLYVWILKVHKFPQTVVAGRTGGGGIPDLYKHHEEVETGKAKPVLSALDFDSKKKNLLSKLPSNALVN